MENEKMCGIYKITNMVNGKVYIGQSVDIEKRWKEHKRHSKTRPQKLYCAMRKYGFENFSFEILMLCEEDLLDLMEIYYIKLYNSFIEWENNNGYNMTIGGNTIKGFKHTKKTKEKISKMKKGKKLSEEHKRKMGESRKGKPRSEETKRKISESHKGEKCYMWGKHHSEERRKKMGESRKGGNNGRAKKVYCGGIIFACAKDCAEYYCKNHQSIVRWLNGKRKLPKEFQNLGLRYATDEDIQNHPTYDKNIHGEKADIDIYVSNGIKIFCDKMIFPSINECGLFYDIHLSIMARWLKGKHKMPQKFVDLGLRYATEEDILTYSMYKKY